jgi:hypothetical protein
MAKTAGWPTPVVQNAKHGAATDWELARAGHATDQLHIVAAMAGWPTPKGTNGPHCIASQEAAETEAKRKGWSNSLDVAVFAPWSTPRANKWGFPDAHGSQEAPLASWATPTTRDHKDGSSDGTVLVNGLLGRQVWQTNWPTPKRSDAERGGQETRTGRKSNLVDRVMLSGTTSSGSPAATAGRGQLNPAFSLWLMGYPEEWGNCAPQAMRSSRRSRPSS